MPLLPCDQRSPEWFEARKGKITASLAAAILGIDKHKGPLAAFNEITGRTTNNGNKHTSWGVEFEAQARQDYECVSGNLVADTGFWVHPTLAWLGASPDGLINSMGLVEVKCPSILPDVVPEAHVVQMAVQLAVTGRQWCDYFAWNQNGHFLKRVERFPDLEWGMISKLEAFYNQYIAPDIAPPRARKACV